MMRPKNIQSGFFLVLLALTTLAFVGLTWAFFEPIVWAAVFAIVFYPMYGHLVAKMKGREGLAAITACLLIVLVIILPIVLVGLAVANEASQLYARAAPNGFDVARVTGFYERLLPVFSNTLERFGVTASDIQGSLTSAAASASQVIGTRAVAYTQNLLTVSLMFVIMLYLLYFFFKDGQRILDAIVRALPLGDEHERRLMQRFADVARATLKGTLIVGVVQGALGGLAFFALGVEGALFWGVIMALASLIPSVGTALVWVPAAIVLFATDHPIKGIIMVVVGGGVISMVDNFLRPMLVGRDTHVPDYLILITSLGGIALFGLTGLVIGPVVAALFLTVWEMFGEEFDYVEPVLEVVVVTSDGEGSPLQHVPEVVIARGAETAGGR